MIYIYICSEVNHYLNIVYFSKFVNFSIMSFVLILSKNVHFLLCFIFIVFCFLYIFCTVVTVYFFILFDIVFSVVFVFLCRKGQGHLIISVSLGHINKGRQGDHHHPHQGPEIATKFNTFHSMVYSSASVWQCFIGTNVTKSCNSFTRFT